MNENEKNPDHKPEEGDSLDIFNDTIMLDETVDWNIVMSEVPNNTSSQNNQTEESAKKPKPKKQLSEKQKKQIMKQKQKEEKRKKKNNKPKRFFSPIFIVLLVCFIAVFSWIGYVSAYVVPLIWGNLGNEDTADVTKEEQIATFEKGQFTVLMMGCDARPGEDASRSDTLMVAFVDLNNANVRLVSIPRDTHVTLPSGWRTKINHAYAEGGIEDTVETLKKNFDIDIDYTAEVDFQGFIDVIDALGGITIDVPMNMDYAAEGIDLKEGLQTLDGDQALQFCRFRSDGQGDLGRVERQQLFMSTLKDQLMSMGTVLKIPDICTAIKNNVVTNLTGSQLLQIMMQLSDGFDLITLEPPGEGRYGEDGISYYYLYEEKADQFFEDVVNYRPTAQELEAEKAKNQGDTETEQTDSSSEGTDETSDN